MEELLAIAERSSPLPIRDIVSWIYNKNVELANSSPEKISDFLSIVFDFLTQNPASHGQPDWDKLRFLLIVMIISLFPSPSNIPPISVITNHGPLFSILLVLDSFRGVRDEYRDQYMKAWIKGVEIFDKETSVKTFYSPTHFYYLHALPFLLKTHLKPEKFTELLAPFLEEILKTTSDKININFISITTDMFRQITSHLLVYKNNNKISENTAMNENIKNVTQNFIKSFEHMLKICTQCPTIILLNLLHPWYAFAKFTYEPNSEGDNVNFREQIGMFASYFEVVAQGKYHELHRNFPWYLAILFYAWAKTPKQKACVLYLVCHAFRSVLRLETLKSVSESTKKIHILMCNHATNEGSWEIYHILTSCESAIELGISDLKKIHAISVNINLSNDSRNFNNSKRPMRKRLVKLADQIFEEDINPEIDNELATKIYEVEYSDFETAKKDFEEQIMLLDKSRSKLMTAITFQFLFIETVINDLLNSDTHIASISYHYISKLVKLGIKIMIVSSQRILMLKLFKANEIQNNQSFPVDSNLSPGYFSHSQTSNYTKKIPSFSIICQRYVEFTERIPVKYYPLLAREIAELLFAAKRKNQLSFLFIQSFSLLRPEYSPNNIQPKDSLYFHVICQLMQITSLHMNYLLSNSSDDTRLLYEWILFVIRLGKLNGKEECHPIIYLFLKDYHRLISSSVISNIKKISNQAFALKIIKIYFNSVHDDNEHYRIRSLQRIYDEIQPYAKKESLKSLLRIVIPEKDAINIPALLSLLSTSLSSDDEELVKMASELCIDILKNEKIVDSNSSNIIELFNSWYSSISRMRDESGLKVLKLIPIFASAFIRPQQQSIATHHNFIHEGTGFNITDIINEISFNISVDKEELSSLFVLIVICFEEMKKKVLIKEVGLKEPMKSLLSLLCYCSNFNFIKDKVSAFSSDLVHDFADLFVQGKDNLFILSLISIAGNNRSENSKYAINLCIAFFEYVQTMDVDIELIKRTVDEMMCFFNPSMRLFSMLCGLTLFSRFLPKAVSLHTIRSFLISSNEFFIYDIEFTTILNRMLKQFLNSRTYEEQREFVLCSFDALSTTLLSCSLILLKRLSKLKIKLPIHDCSEIDNGSDPLLVFQRLSAALACGIECPLTFTDKMKKMIHDFITARIDNVNFIEKLSRKMSLCMSIINSPDAFHMLAQDNIFIKNFLSFFVNTLSSRIPSMRKNAEKAFYFLVNQYSDDSYTSRQIDEYCNNPKKIFHFFGPQHERIAFYRRLTKIIPQKIPSTIVIEFFKAIFQYTEFKDSKKFSLLSNLLHFVKYLTIQEFINSEQVRSIILSSSPDISSPNYLIEFIEKILLLYQHQEIPYRSILQKYVCLFLKMFPQQTLEYIIQNRHSQSNSEGIANVCKCTSFTFLYDLIETDETLVFFNTFIQYLESNTDYVLYHPSAFNILSKLSNNSKFAQMSSFQTILDTINEHLLKSINECVSRGTRIFTMMMEIGNAEINTFKYKPNVNRILKFTNIFNYTMFSNTCIYRKFVNIVFKRSSNEFITSIINYLMTTKPSITPKAFEILLGHSLKYVQKIDEKILQMIWAFLISKVTQHSNKFISPVLVCIINLLSKSKPPIENIKTLLVALQNTISLSDTHIVLYSIKLACIFVEMKVMPDELYFQIAQQLFSYSKFFDPPYVNYTYKFMNMRKDLTDKVPGKLIETIAFFPHDKFTSVREIKRMIEVFTELPHFISSLPTSPITTLALSFETRLFQKKQKIEMQEFEPLFISGIKFCVVAKPSKAEVHRFIRACFLFFKFIITQDNSSKEFHKVFFEYLIKHCDEIKPIAFPIEYLKSINQNLFSYYGFNFVCCATQFEGDVLFKDYSNYVNKALNLVQEQDIVINSLFLKTLIDYITANPAYNDAFHSQISSLVKNTMPLFNKVTRDRIIILCNGMIAGSPATERFQHLMDIWNFFCDFPHNPQQNLSISKMFRFLATCVDYLPSKDQLPYIHFLIQKTEESSEYNVYFTHVLKQLLESDHIIIPAKRLLLDAIPIIFLHASEKAADNVIISMKHFSQKNSIDMRFEIVSVLLAQCLDCTHSLRMKYYHRIIDTISDITFEQFIGKLPLFFWSNIYLPITTALITEMDSSFWLSTFSFGPSLSNISNQLAAISFSKHINSKNIEVVNNFFLKIISQKPHHKYSQVTDALLHAFYNNHIFLSSKIAEKALKYSHDQDICINFIDSNPSTSCDESIHPSYSFLVPHYLNDSIFNKYLPNISLQEASAIALTFLNEYQAASIIYDRADDQHSSIFKAMNHINSKFNFNIIQNNSQDFNFYAFSSPLHMTDQINDIALSKLNVIFNSLKHNPSKVNDLLDDIEMLNLKQLQKHRVPSLFEKERIASLEKIVLTIRSHLNSSNESDNLASNDHSSTISSSFSKVSDFEKAVNPAFVSSLASLDFYLKGRSIPPNCPTVVSGSDAVILLSGSMGHDFTCVSGITNRGLLAVGPQQIDSIMNTMSLKITEKQVSTDDWCRFAPFCFNVFLVQPTADLFQVAFNIYANMINASYSSPSDDTTSMYLIKSEAAARIITLIRLALSSNMNPDIQKQMFEIISASSSLFKREYADVWKNWLIQLVGLANNDWFCSIIGDLAKEMWYRSSLYSTKLGCQQISEALQMRPEAGPLAMMTRLEESFDAIFELNFNLFYRAIVSQDVNHAKEFVASDKIPDTFLEFSALMINPSDFANVGNDDDIRELRKSEEIIHKINCSLPFVIPLRVDIAPQISIYRIYGDFKLLAPDLLIFYATTSTASRQTFLVQRSNNPDPNVGFSTSIVTMANTTIIFKYLLQNCYQSRSRMINLHAQPIFEVGPRYIMIPLSSDIDSLSTVFSNKVKITPSTYISMNIEDRPEIRDDSLLQYVTQTVMPIDYIRIRPLLLRAFAAQSTVRYIFGATYPDIHRVLFSAENMTSVLLHSDFEKCILNLNYNFQTDMQSTFRLSPNIVRLFGQNCFGEYLLAMSASAKSFSKQLEIVRSCFEVLIADPSNNNFEISNSYILSIRNEIEKRLFEISPPTGSSVNESDCTEWYTNLMTIIQNANNSSIQNPSALPWF